MSRSSQMADHAQRKDTANAAITFHPEKRVARRTAQKVKHFGQFTMGISSPSTFSMAATKPRWLAATHEKASMAMSYNVSITLLRSR